MTKLKKNLATTLGIIAAVILAPFVAFFGLMTLGFVFGLSLVAAGTVAVLSKRAMNSTVEAQAMADSHPVV